MSVVAKPRSFLLLGSNIHPQKNIPQALQKLKTLGKICKISSIYQTPAVGEKQQPDYYNVAVLLESSLGVQELKAHLLRIEKEMGRVRSEDKNAARTIDIDISLFEKETDADLKIPDPQIHTCAHIAIPLAELEGNFKHPLWKKNLKEIAQELKTGWNGSVVKK